MKSVQTYIDEVKRLNNEKDRLIQQFAERENEIRKASYEDGKTVGVEIGVSLAINENGNLPENLDLAVGAVREYAFYGHKHVVKVNLSSTTIFKKHCFENCVNLKEVKFGYRTQKINEYAFYGCTSLTTLNLNPKLGSYSDFRNIDAYAFGNCTALQSVTMRKTFHNSYGLSIASTAFSGCTNLTDIYVNWNEGQVSGAPWGATNATIHYNSIT